MYGAQRAALRVQAPNVAAGGRGGALVGLVELVRDLKTGSGEQVAVPV
jgi:hypothetical protein